MGQLSNTVEHTSVIMPQLSPAPLNVSPAEQAGLIAIVKRHQSPQQLAQRARIILAAAAGAHNRTIARDLGVSRDMVQLWRRRWCETSQGDASVAACLGDAERPGAPAAPISQLRVHGHFW
jgi:putative transposase